MSFFRGSGNLVYKDEGDEKRGHTEPTSFNLTIEIMRNVPTMDRREQMAQANMIKVGYSLGGLK